MNQSTATSVANPSAPALVPCKPIALPVEQGTEASLDIPWSQLLPLMLYKMADAASYIVIFPFITEMITSFDVPHDKI
jgi:hypothetical protein